MAYGDDPVSVNPLASASETPCMGVFIIMAARIFTVIAISFWNSDRGKTPILFTRRFLSNDRMCQTSMSLSIPFSPKRILYSPVLIFVVNGTPQNILAVNLLTITIGLLKSTDWECCSEPTLTPTEHHQISRSWKSTGRSSRSIFFFEAFHRSKSLSMRTIVIRLRIIFNKK